jgi:antitoxin YefM
MRTLSFSQARSHLKQVLDRVEADADFTIITRREAGDAVVMSLDTFNSWRETLYLLSSPANAQRLSESISQLKAGKAQRRALVEPESLPKPRAAARSEKPKLSKQRKVARRKHA